VYKFSSFDEKIFWPIFSHKGGTLTKKIKKNYFWRGKEFEKEVYLHFGLDQTIKKLILIYNLKIQNNYCIF
jgi:hypothetical protein